MSKLCKSEEAKYTLFMSSYGRGNSYFLTLQCQMGLIDLVQQTQGVGGGSDRSGRSSDIALSEKIRRPKSAPASVVLDTCRYGVVCPESWCCLCHFAFVKKSVSSKNLMLKESNLHRFWFLVGSALDSVKP